MAKRKRKATPAQLKALAKGRRTLAARRKNPAYGKFYNARADTVPGRGAYAKARAVARGAAKPAPTRRINPQRRCNPNADKGFVIVSFKPGARGEALQFWSGRDWDTHAAAARYATSENAIAVARKCKRYCAVTRASTPATEIRAKMAA